MVNISASLRLIDSKSELKEILGNEHYLHIIIGQDSQQEKAFYIATIIEKTDFRKGTQIGIVSEGHGLKPCVILDEDNKIAYIGNNQEVNIIDCQTMTIKKILHLDSLLYDLIPIESKSTIIIVHELGVECIFKDGDILWKHSTDVITGYNIDDRYLTVTTEEQKLLISTSSGDIIKKEEC